MCDTNGAGKHVPERVAKFSPERLLHFCLRVEYDLSHVFVFVCVYVFV